MRAQTKRKKRRIGPFKVRMRLDRSAEFITVLKKLQDLKATSPNGLTTHEYRSRPAHQRIVGTTTLTGYAGNVWVFTPDPAQETSTESDDAAEIAVEIGAQDLEALASAGWVSPGSDVDDDTFETETDSAEPAPEPEGPFPWEASSPWRSTLLLAGGVVLGGLGTLGIVSAINNGIAYTHLAGLLAFVVLVIGFERTVAVVDLLWKARLANKDAAATEAWVARLNTDS